MNTGNIHNKNIQANSTNRISGIVFDKDGTLFDFTAVWSVWCDRVIDELSEGSSVTAGALADAIGYDRSLKQFTSGSLIVSGAADDTARAMTACLPDHDYADVARVCEKHMQNLPLVPVKNLRDVLAALKASGIRLGVATNDSEAAAHMQLAESKAGGYFDFVCGYDSGFGSKPGPGMLQAFCVATGLAAANVAMVGDSLHDINAGVAAGVGLTVGVLTGPATEDELTVHADVVLADIGGLLNLLLKV